MWQMQFRTRQDQWTRRGRLLLCFLPLLGSFCQLVVPASGGVLAPVVEKIELGDGKLTVRLVNASLRRALEDVGRLSGAEIVWLNQVGEETVSAEFTALPVAEALERLLKGKNFLLFYATREEEGKLARVWISSGTGKKAPSLVPAVKSAPPEQTVHSLSSAQLTQSGEEKEEGQSSLSSMSVDEVVQVALGEKDPTFRLDAISRLGQEISANPQIRELLVRIAREDSDPDARQIAALTLGEETE